MIYGKKDITGIGGASNRQGAGEEAGEGADAFSGDNVGVEDMGVQVGRPGDELTRTSDYHSYEVRLHSNNGDSLRVGGHKESAQSGANQTTGSFVKLPMMVATQHPYQAHSQHQHHHQLEPQIRPVQLQQPALIQRARSNSANIGSVRGGHFQNGHVPQRQLLQGPEQQQQQQQVLFGQHQYANHNYVRPHSELSNGSSSLHGPADSAGLGAFGGWGSSRAEFGDDVQQGATMHDYDWNVQFALGEPTPDDLRRSQGGSLKRRVQSCPDLKETEHAYSPEKRASIGSSRLSQPLVLGQPLDGHPLEHDQSTSFYEMGFSSQGSHTDQGTPGASGRDQRLSHLYGVPSGTQGGGSAPDSTGISVDMFHKAIQARMHANENVNKELMQQFNSFEEIGMDSLIRSPHSGQFVDANVDIMDGSGSNSGGSAASRSAMYTTVTSTGSHGVNVADMGRVTSASPPKGTILGNTVMDADTYWDPAEGGGQGGGSLGSRVRSQRGGKLKSDDDNDEKEDSVEEPDSTAESGDMKPDFRCSWHAAKGGAQVAGDGGGAGGDNGGGDRVSTALDNLLQLPTQFTGSLGRRHSQQDARTGDPDIHADTQPTSQRRPKRQQLERLGFKSLSPLSDPDDEHHSLTAKVPEPGSRVRTRGKAGLDPVIVSPGDEEGPGLLDDDDDGDADGGGDEDGGGEGEVDDIDHRRRERRLARNRVSARLRRQKKKHLVDACELDVGKLEEALHTITHHSWGSGGQPACDLGDAMELERYSNTSLTHPEGDALQSAKLQALRSQGEWAAYVRQQMNIGSVWRMAEAYAHKQRHQNTSTTTAITSLMRHAHVHTAAATQAGSLTDGGLGSAVTAADGGMYSMHDMLTSLEKNVLRPLQVPGQQIQDQRAGATATVSGSGGKLIMQQLRDAEYGRSLIGREAWGSSGGGLGGDGGSAGLWSDEELLELAVLDKVARVMGNSKWYRTSTCTIDTYGDKMREGLNHQQTAKLLGWTDRNETAVSSLRLKGVHGGRGGSIGGRRGARRRGGDGQLRNGNESEDDGEGADDDDDDDVAGLGVHLMYDASTTRNVAGFLFSQPELC